MHRRMFYVYVSHFMLVNRFFWVSLAHKRLRPPALHQHSWIITPTHDHYCQLILQRRNVLYEVHLKKIRCVHITASSWLFITTVCSECQTKHTDRPTVVGLLDPEDEGTTLLPHVGNYIYRSTWHNFSKDLNVHKLCRENFNPLTPNDPYSGRTAPLTCILYIYSTNLGAEYLNMVYTLRFFLFKMQFVS
jgi:hypothetical protein